MTVEWSAGTKHATAVETVQTADYEGLELKVTRDRYGVRWSVWGRLDDFDVSSYGWNAETPAAARRVAQKAARRMRALGVTGR